MSDASDTSESFGLDRFLIDPMGTLRAAQAEGWLVGSQPFPIVTRYEDVRELLADPRMQASFGEVMVLLGVTSGAFYEWMVESPLNWDGEEHKRWRSTMSRTFTPRNVDGLRPFMRETAHAVIDGWIARGTCELVAEFADVFPSLCMCELIGVPEADRDRFRQWANTIGLGFSPITMLANIAAIDDALTKLLAFADELFALRRAEPRDDLVSRIAHASDDEGHGLPHEVARGSLAGLVFAGHETTKNQIGWMVSDLSAHPDIWDAVAGGSLDPAAVVEESLRHRSAVTSIGRRASVDIERHGTTVAAGSNLLLSLWGADHDATMFAADDTFAPGAHDGAPHLAFGHGAHHCLGAALARAELQESLTALATRLTCPRIDDGAQWKPPVGITGPELLPISFGAR